ncbi:redoxin domain-containing protein [Pontibacter sp. G13]|uniref:TlpA family protein disulfide reductase n=1 Tax=Pontibacter sp. G13 TaxID=3074898 RepID=UPI00288A3A9F|nr:redoxin domain-containing protein [Pontibacter sp. G13]WNJ16499.1 hypothetical protein RJD25_16660 [Pontibacter sp. G13]
MKKHLILFSWLVVIQLAWAQAQTLPPFSFEAMDGTPFTSANLDPQKSTFIMLFDPYCDHCDQQATYIAEAADQFEDVQFVFVTIETDNEAIQNFRDRHFADTGLEHLNFVKDTQIRFESYFGYTDDVINIYLYKPGRKQPKYFGKETEAEQLLKFL